MEAKSLNTISSTMTVISDPAEIKAALNHELEVLGKRVLVTKGNDMAKTVEHIYRGFAAHKDLSGKSFMLSSKNKGLVHRDKWAV